MDLSNRVFGKDPKIWGNLTSTGTSMVNLYELNQNLVLNTVFGTGKTLDVTSSSTADASAGTGAQKVTIYGLGTDWKELSEVVTMNGQTAVQTTNSFIRVFAASVTTTGSGNAAAGDIYVIVHGTSTYTAGVPGTLTSALIKIPIGWGSSDSGYYTIPAGAVGKIFSLMVGNATQTAKLLIQAQDNGASDTEIATIMPIELNIQGGFEHMEVNEDLLQFAEKTDIVMKIIPATSGSVTTAMMHINLVKVA